MFFPCRVKWPILASGVMLCLTGVGTAILWGIDTVAVAKGVIANWPTFPIMTAAAFLWAFYTNAVRKWGDDANGTGWFMVCAGCIFLGLWIADGKPLGFNTGMVVPFFLHATVVNAISYLFWDIGVRRGDIRLMGMLANFLPLGSVLFGTWYLQRPTTPGLWFGAVMVIGGAVLCRTGLVEYGCPETE